MGGQAVSKSNSEADGEPGPLLPGKAPVLYGEEFPKVYQSETAATRNRKQVAHPLRKIATTAPESSRNSPPTERDRIHAIQKLARGRFPQLLTGIGDDAAVLRVPPGRQLVVTTDMLLEGVHFRSDWHTPQSAGHRCLARGLSDIAAMGATPLAAFLSLAAPPELAGKWTDDFFAGLLALAREHRIPLAGGDLAQATTSLSADITVLGTVPAGHALLRSSARPGDRLYVTGTLGGAAAGLHLLRTSARSSSANRHLLQAQLFPTPRIRAGLALSRLARRGTRIACMDISDGLSLDLHRLCHASGIGAELTVSTIPIAHGATLADALHGGEDYELLFTAPATSRIPKSIAGTPVTCIGAITRSKSIISVTESGTRAPLPAQGYEHFTPHAT